MKRTGWVWVALAVPLAFASPASAAVQTHFGFQIGITNAPPRRVVFHDDPVVRVVPGHSVYYIDDDRYDYDMFRQGRDWYLCDEGYWYRAPSHRGPFLAIDVRYVPRSVLYVPASHWRHRYSTRSWDRERSWDRDRSRDRGRSYDRVRYKEPDRSWNRGQSRERHPSWDRGRASNRDRSSNRDGSWTRDRDRDRVPVRDRVPDRDRDGRDSREPRYSRDNERRNDGDRRDVDRRNRDGDRRDDDRRARDSDRLRDKDAD